MQGRDGLAVQHGVGEEVDAGDRHVAADQADHHGERKPADDMPGDGLQVGPGAQEQPGDLLDGQRRRRDEFASVEIDIPRRYAYMLAGLSQSSSFGAGAGIATEASAANLARVTRVIDEQPLYAMGSPVRRSLALAMRGTEPCHDSIWRRRTSRVFSSTFAASPSSK